MSVPVIVAPGGEGGNAVNDSQRKDSITSVGRTDVTEVRLHAVGSNIKVDGRSDVKPAYKRPSTGNDLAATRFRLVSLYLLAYVTILWRSEAAILRTVSVKNHKR